MYNAIETTNNEIENVSEMKQNMILQNTKNGIETNFINHILIQWN